VLELLKFTGRTVQIAMSPKAIVQNKVLLRREADEPAYETPLEVPPLTGVRVFFCRSGDIEPAQAR
jgi:hypothetical protein